MTARAEGDTLRPAALVRLNLLTPGTADDKAAVRKAMHDWLNTGVLR